MFSNPGALPGFIILQRSMQDSQGSGFKGCMKQNRLHISGWVLGLILALSGCSKEMSPDVVNPSYKDSESSSTTLAIGTFRIREGEPTVWVDASTLAYVTNPERVSDLADGTRIFLEYASTEKDYPDFCTEAVYVLWASTLEVGTVSSAKSALEGDPMNIVLDWITTLEDGFLTIHYNVYASGSVQHTFMLSRGEKDGEFVLLHDAHGDTGSELTDGIICFPVASLLPDTEGETVTLSLDYLNLENTRTRLTVDYRSPE